MTEEPKKDVGEVATVDAVEAPKTDLGAASDGAERPSAIPPDEMARLTDEIVTALKTVHDPEIPADIYELGLIYRVDIDDDNPFLGVPHL